MRTILLAFALTLSLPASALAAGTLTVSIAGAGSVSGSGISCSRVAGVAASGVCSAKIDSQATITAQPAPGFNFDGWSGACAAAGAECTLSVPDNRATTANFRDVEAPSVTLDAPAAGTVAGPMPVTASVTDNGVIDRVELVVRGIEVVDYEAPYTATFPTATVDDGPAAVSATAFDRAGNSHAATVDVNFDNTLPVLDVTGPDRQAFEPGSTQTWAIAASDPGSGITGIRCSIVASGLAPVLAPCSGASAHSVTGLPEGRYTFVVRARDGAGNIGEETRLFRIETTPLATVLAGASSLAPVPLAAGSGSAVAPPQIAVALGFKYASTSHATKLSNFVVRNVPAGATVTVRCSKGCGKKLLKRQVKRGGRISLKRMTKRPLKVDTTITVIVAKPGASSAVKVLTIRARKAPLVTTQCQPEGAPVPVAC